MKCDMNMLKKFAILWHKRYEQDPSLWNQARAKWYEETLAKDSLIDQLIRKPPVLLEIHKLKVGIDFHCFPYLAKQCTANFPG